ncbi:hypothetical protein EDD15DRAFT_2107211, partial [Pisolithus albus]
RTRRRLVLTPAGRPITHAASPLEVVTCLLDLIIAHKRIWLLGILHRDISINNAMMYEEVDGSNCTVGPGDRTVSSVGKNSQSIPHAYEQGTLPFMAVELLCAVNNKPVKHTVAHDLESFVYLLCWIVTFFAGPESRLRKDSTKLAIEGWYAGND